MSTPLRLCARLGPGDAERCDRMADLLATGPAVIDGSGLRLHVTGPWTAHGPGMQPSPEADGRMVDPSLGGWVGWAAAPLPRTNDPAEVTAAGGAVIVVDADGSVEVRSSTSGALPVYVDLGDTHVDVASRASVLARTRPAPIEADVDAWAEIIASGGPLGGRTPTVGVHRLQPGERVRLEPGGRPELVRDDWAWLDATSEPRTAADVVEALGAAVSRLGREGALAPLLSGGWDSRILAALAASAGDTHTTAWTTSSDTGTALEELVAAEVASALSLRHHLVAPRHDRFGPDVEHYAETVDHQSSFHVWLSHLASGLPAGCGTVLDGLGGGIFYGGAFDVSEHSGTSLLDLRFARLARYLDAAEDVVRPEVATQLRARTRAGFERVALPLLDHPEGTAFTAYLTRTLPGIALGPMALVAHHAHVAAPFLDDAAVRAGLAVPLDRRADGQLYPEMLRTIHPDLARMPTASDRTPRRRVHRRRGASKVAVDHYRSRITDGPVGDLLAPHLRTAGPDLWQRYLSRTRHQHLIRSLAIMASWLDVNDDLIAGSPVDDLLRAAR